MWCVWLCNGCLALYFSVNCLLRVFQISDPHNQCTWIFPVHHSAWWSCSSICHGPSGCQVLKTSWTLQCNHISLPQANGRVQNRTMLWIGNVWLAVWGDAILIWPHTVGLVSISKHAAGLRYTDVYLTIGLNKAKETWYSLERWRDCYGARPSFLKDGLNRFSFECLHKLPIKPSQYQNKHDIISLLKCGTYYLKLFLWHMITFCLAWRSLLFSIITVYSIRNNIIQLTA